MAREKHDSHLSQDQGMENSHTLALYKYRYLGKNDHPTILREILLIKFSSLTFLNLCGNKMESVESISWLYVPQMNFFAISNASITKISTISSARRNWGSVTGENLTICNSVTLIRYSTKQDYRIWEFTLNWIQETVFSLQHPTTAWKPMESLVLNFEILWRKLLPW